MTTTVLTHDGELTLTTAVESTRLGYHTDGDHLVVFAAYNGAPHHPAWYEWMLDNPAVTVELDGETFSAIAAVTTGPERYRIWSSAVRQAPVLAEYQVRAGERTIPVITLHRQDV